MTAHADRSVAPGDIPAVAPGESRAVALQYTDSLPAPLVVASGRGALAEAIRRIARESGVPVVSDPALAASLIELDVSALIPESLYQVVAELLVFVRDLRAAQ